MSVTLNDIADKAGVSLATVSLALNGNEKVNIDTRERIQRIAREMNYIPNARARALVNKSTKTIGLVIPEVINPFFAELAQSIKSYVRDKGFNLILCSTDYKSDEEKRYINMFRSGQVDGAIFACVGDMMAEHNQMITQLARENVPVVYVDRDGVDNELIPVIKSDLFSAAYQAADHLINLGHSRIGFIGQSQERLAGFKKALKEAEIEVKEQYIFYDYLTIEGGYLVGKKVATMQKMPTGLIAINDEMAIGIIQSLTANGVKVPEDVSVVGIDNIKMANFYNPPLTTVDIPVEKMGQKAAAVLLKKIAGYELDPTEKYIVFPSELIIRASTASCGE